MYLAWDVGVKNLAFCLGTKDGKIKKWDIINLTNQKIVNCVGVNKNGKACTSQSCCFDVDTKDFLCKKHSSGKKVKELYICFNCKTKCKYIHKESNEYVCAKHLPTDKTKDYCELINNKSVTKTSLFKLGNNLI